MQILRGKKGEGYTLKASGELNLEATGCSHGKKRLALEREMTRNAMAKKKKDKSSGIPE